MNPRLTGKITKKYFGEPKTNPKGFWYRLDAVYVQEAGAQKGVRMSYFSNPPKENPSAEAIEDRYPECVEGMTVDIEYVQNGQYFNIEDMQPHGSTLPASDPIAKMTAKPTPQYLKPGPAPEEPLPSLDEPLPPPVARPTGDQRDWQIARSVSAKLIAESLRTEGAYANLSLYWTGETDSAVDVTGSAIAKWIIEGSM